MPGECDTCRYRNVPFDVDPCRSCIRHRSDGGDGWEPAEPPASGCPAGVVVPWGDAGPCYVGFPDTRPAPTAPPDITARVAELEAAYAAQSRAPATHGPDAPPGVKLDGAKTRWDLLPWPALELVAQAFTQGASKYSDYGWKTLPDARRRYFAAAIRHAVAWVKGEKLDPESGLPHLAHLTCNALFLLSFDLGETGGPAALEEPKPPAGKP